MEAPAHIVERAVRLITDHFESLNAADANRAKAQLFHPRGMSTAPLDIYVRGMISLAPFRLIGVELDRWVPLRQARHGYIGTVFVTISVDVQQLGECRKHVPVWWLPESDVMLIAVRFSDWVLEARLVSSFR